MNVKSLVSVTVPDLKVFQWNHASSESLNFDKFSGEMKRVLIIHSFSEQELSEHSFGGTRLIWEQKNFYEKVLKCKVKLLSLPKLGSLTSVIFGHVFNVKVDKGVLYVRQDSERRWLLNLLFFIFTHYVCKIDFLCKKKLLNVIKVYRPDLILCNHPAYACVISDIANSVAIPCFLYEHNVEWLLFDRLLNNKRRYKPLIFLMKHIELSAIKKSDAVICVSNEDRTHLIRNQVPPAKIFVWVPFIPALNKKMLKIPAQLKCKLEGKFVVGFVGAHFEPNIVSVENIIKTAKKVDEDVVFLVLGRVCDAFRNRHDIPENVILKGFVQDLDSYLSLCDAFINPKTICDTGVEVKMFDYLKFDKPIIATRIGARGFEKFKNVVICDLESFPSKIGCFLQKWKADM